MTNKKFLEMIDESWDIIAKGLDKLSQLEDIEKELGIDLITLFKALKQGYIYVLLNNHIFKIQIMGINYNTGYLLLYDEDNQCTFENYEINAYGKKWALAKKELENEYKTTIKNEPR